MAVISCLRTADFGIQRKSPSGGTIGYQMAPSTRTGLSITSSTVPRGSCVVMRLSGASPFSLPAITSAPSTITVTFALPVSIGSTLPRWILRIQLSVPTGGWMARNPVSSSRTTTTLSPLRSWPTGAKLIACPARTSTPSSSMTAILRVSGAAETAPAAARNHKTTRLTRPDMTNPPQTPVRPTKDNRAIWEAITRPEKFAREIDFGSSVGFGVWGLGFGLIASPGSAKRYPELSHATPLAYQTRHPKPQPPILTPTSTLCPAFPSSACGWSDRSATA